MPTLRRRLLCLAVITLACAGCAAAPPPPVAADAPPPTAADSRPTAHPPTSPVVAPVWHVGDRWTYEWTAGKETGTKTVTVVDLREVNGVRYYVVKVGDAEHYYTPALHWAAAVREGTVEARMVPPQPWFMWPLTEDAHWTHRGRFEQREGVASYDDRFSVAGAEWVDVPAGRYQAIKVVRETDRNDGDQYWFASEVRWYARWLGRRGDAQFEERLREYRSAAIPR